MNSRQARRSELFLILMLVLVALGLRLYRVGDAGLAEDEAGKWFAVQEYRKGHFAGVNSEHPMLLKLMAWASLTVAHRWEQWAAPLGWPQPRSEAWLRLPNLLLGAATTLAIYLLGREMLGALGAGAAAWFWAVSPLSVTLNRVLKEETPFAFFTVLAFYCYFHAKSATNERRAARYFLLSGCCFGLALASNYIAIGQFGLVVLIWHVANQVGISSRQMRPYFRRILISLGAVFLLANPVVLSPANLRSVASWSREKTIQHHGYNLDGKVLMNNSSATPYGLPWYFYFWVLGVKSPVPILAACLAGCLLLLYEHDSLIAIYLRVMLTFWFVPYSLAGSKWIRYLLLALPAVYLAGGWAVDRLWGYGRRTRAQGARRTALALIALVAFVWPAAEALRWAPFDQLYLNSLGGGRANVARFFPHDEIYDLGAREAVAYVCQSAPRGALVAASNPMVVRYYLAPFHRPDLRPMALFDPSYVPRAGDYLLIQPARRYFETEGLELFLARRGAPLREIVLGGVLTARVYRF